MSQTADTKQETPSAKSPKENRKRLWLFRLLACSLPLVLFAIAELTCRLFGLGNPSLGPDPFAGFQEIRPLFVLDDTGTQYCIPEARFNFFAPEAFPKEKPPRTKRIFCLGGSTVQGRPYSTPTSFPTFLKLALSVADQSRYWEVINCGGISYASYRLVPILEEVLQYEPDLIIVCTGHNEFLEDRSYHHLKSPSPLLKSAVRIGSYSRLLNCVSQLIYSDSVHNEDRPMLSAETDPMLDYHNGLAAYHRDDDWHTSVTAHFEHNVHKLIETCQRDGVPILLVIPPSNLYDCPPFKSVINAKLSTEARNQRQRLIEQAQATMRTDSQQAISIFREALTIDDRHAATWYELGKCYQSLGLHTQAHDAFVRARDEDICPLRILSGMEEQLRQLANANAVPLLDMSVQMRDGQSLVDHVHPDFEGNQDIAKQLLELMSKHRWCQLPEGWHEQVNKALTAQMDSLDDFYFLRGQRTLDALRGWTEGLSDGPAAEDRFPNRIP